MAFDPTALMNFLQASQGNSQGYGSPQPDQVPNQTASPNPAQPAGQPQGIPDLGPRLTGVKGYLSNVLYGIGEMTKHQFGMPTDREIQLQNLQASNAQLKTQADAFESTQRGKLFGAQADQLGQMVTLPNGVSLPFSIAQKAYPALVTGELNKEGRLGAAQIQALSRMNQTTMKAAYMPDGSLGVGLYDKAGNFKGYADNAVVPSGYLEKIRQGQTFKVNADGTLESIPTTSVSKPVIPGAPQITNPTSNSPNAGQQKIRSLAQGKGATPVTNASPVQSGGKPFQAPSAADVGNAYDPQTNQYFITNRAEAAQNGYQNFQKSSPAQIENDRQLNNRVTDVQQKIERYQQTFNNDITANDKLAMSTLLGDDSLKLGAFGAHIPTGWLAQLQNMRSFQQMTPQAQQRFIAFVNAREAMSGYQRVLTGSSRGGEKNLQLQLDTLANPLLGQKDAQEAFNQFKENLRIAAQGLPRMKGVQTPADIENKFNQSNQNTPPPGAKIRDYTSLK